MTLFRPLRPGALFLLLASGIQALPAAATPLDVTQALSEGTARNSQVVRSDAAAEEADVRVSEAFAGFLPRLSLGASHLLDYRYQVLDVNFGGGATSEFAMKMPLTTLSADAGINLFDGLMTTHSYKAARLARDAARKEAARTRLQVENEIRLRFYQALSAKMLAEVADQNVRTLQDHLARSNALVKGGSGTRIDILRVEVQLSEAIPEQQQAHDNVLIARMNLSQAMGLGQDDREPSGELPVPEVSKLPADLKFEPSLRGDLAALSDRSEAADQIQSAATSVWFPRVGLNAQTQFYNNRDQSFDTDQFRNSYTIALTASWTLFDWSTISKARSTGHQQVQIQSAAQAANLKAPVEFELWKRKYLSNSALFSARRRAIESAQESVRLARLGYENGTRTGSEVLDTELDLFRARAGAVRAQVDAAEAWVNLELAVGHTL